MDALDIIDALKIILIPRSPAVTGTVSRNHALQLCEHLIAEQVDRAVGDFPDRVIIPVHDAVIDKILHDTQAVQLIRDGFLRLQRLELIIIRIRRIIGIRL